MSEPERRRETQARTAAERRWYISAPSGADLRPLIASLQQRGVQPYVLSEVAALGDDILLSAQRAIAAADQVLVVLGQDVDSLNAVFEAGMAAALAKPLVVVTDPAVVVPPDLAGFLIIRARPDDLDAINFALDQAEGRAALSTRFASATGNALGPHADQLLDRALHLLSPTSPAGVERAAMDVLVQALEESGALVADQSARDRGFDLGVWSDDLGAIAANPLLIEIKRSLHPQAAEQALASLLASGHNAQVALIVYLDPASADSAALTSVRFPVLAISLPDLLQQMRAKSFAEVVRQLRNRSVHGLPLTP